jgi:hypothetical protein
MDLLSRLKDTESPRPEAFEQARMALRSRMADAGPGLAPAPGRAPAGAHHRSRRLARVSRRAIGFGVGIGVAAAAVAVTLVITSTPQPASNTNRALASSGSPSASAKAKPSAGPTSASLAVNAKLMSVAANIESNGGSLPGNASLVITTQNYPNGSPDNMSYNLNTDGYVYYWSLTKSGLTKAVANHDNQSDNGMHAREVAAARYAANGDLATARVRMINATPNPFMIGYSPAAKKAFLKKLAVENAQLRREGIKVDGLDTGKALQVDLNNYIWNNCLDVLTAGGDNPQLRAGVLRLLSTVPEVTVVNSTTNGQPTLTLTAGAAVLGGNQDNVLTIDAQTGIPIKMVLGDPGRQQPFSTIRYQVSRVTVADIAAGKF